MTVGTTMGARILLYQLTHPLLGWIARNRWLIHQLFNIRVPRQVTVHFDPTTLTLRGALRRFVRPEDRTALEVGIGQGALLANGLQKETHLDVEGVDCSSSRVESSRQVARYNALEPRFQVSDLFENIPPGRSYDVIFFNPPYVPTREGRRLQLTGHMRADSDRVWDGGQDGSSVLRAFLSAAHGFLSLRGRVLFGFQPIFLSPALADAIAVDCGWEILCRYRRWGVPSVVYVLGSQPALR